MLWVVAGYHLVAGNRGRRYEEDLHLGQMPSDYTRHGHSMTLYVHHGHPTHRQTGRQINRYQCVDALFPALLVLGSLLEIYRRGFTPSASLLPMCVWYEPTRC